MIYSRLSTIIMSNSFALMFDISRLLADPIVLTSSAMLRASASLIETAPALISAPHGSLGRHRCLSTIRMSQHGIEILAPHRSFGRQLGFGFVYALLWAALMGHTGMVE